MIRLEFDGFTIDAPIDRRMTVEQFLTIADKLEKIAGRAHWETPVPEAHHALDQHEYEMHAPVHHEEELRFEHEEVQRLEYFMDKLARQLAKLEQTHLRLERIERAMLDHGIHPKKR